MNITRLFLSIFCLFITLVINQSIGADSTAAIGAGIWDLRDQGIDPELLVPLREYNASKYHLKNINYDRITQFLDDQLIKNRLNPDIFRYYVGIDLDWQIVKRTNGYSLIIPDLTPTASSLLSSLWSSSERTPSYSLNIQDLNNSLATPGNERVQFYRLALIKAIVAAENKGAFHGLSSALAQSTFAYLGQVAQTIEPNLKYVFTALATVYPMITSNKQWIAYQDALDKYILESLDIQLIQTHVKDLEQQLAEQKGSITTTLWSYSPSTSAGTKSALEKRIDIIKDFLTDNDLELKLAQSIRNKKR